MNDKKQKNIKNIIFKILHVISYILSICFIGICILVGVESCNNNNSQKQIDKPINNMVQYSTNYTLFPYEFNNYDFQLEFCQLVNTNTDTSSVNFCNYITSTAVDNYQCTYINAHINNNGQPYIKIIYPNNTRFYIINQNVGTYVNNELYYVSTLRYYTPNVSNIYLGQPITFYNVTNQNFINLFNKYFGEHGGYTETDIENAYNEGYSEGYDVGFNVGATDSSEYDLVLPQSNNFMYLYGDNYLKNYLPNVYISNYLPSNTSSWFYNLEGITFKMYGDEHIFDTIKVGFKTFNVFDYQSGSQTYFAFVNGDFDLNDDMVDFYSYQGATDFLNIIDSSTSLDYKKTHWYYLDSIYYYDSTNDYQIQVFNGLRQMDNLTYYTQNSSTGGGQLVPTSTTISGVYFVKNGWINQNYRRLHIINNSSDLLNVPNTSLNSLTLLEFLTYQNVTGSIVSVPVNNVFSLMSNAFNSLTSLLSIMILPNITLGVLMFLPLVATIVIVIVRIIKKG